MALATLAGLAIGAHHRATANGHPVAPPGIQAVLALEIPKKKTRTPPVPEPVLVVVQRLLSPADGKGPGHGFGRGLGCLLFRSSGYPSMTNLGETGIPIVAWRLFSRDRLGMALAAQHGLR
jgi:hypothetical protein